MSALISSPTRTSARLRFSVVSRACESALERGELCCQGARLGFRAAGDHRFGTLVETSPVRSFDLPRESLLTPAVLMQFGRETLVSGCELVELVDAGIGGNGDSPAVLM